MSAAPTPRAAKRQRLIRLVHIAKRDLGMDDDSYRDALHAATGKRSAGDMTLAELNLAMAQMRRCGFVGKAPKAAGSRKLAEGKQASKIRALWLSLHAAGAVRDPSEAALSQWIKRETGINALQWLDVEDAIQVTERLKKWLGRLNG